MFKLEEGDLVYLNEQELYKKEPLFGILEVIYPSFLAQWLFRTPIKVRVRWFGLNKDLVINYSSVVSKNFSRIVVRNNEIVWKNQC